MAEAKEVRKCGSAELWDVLYGRGTWVELRGEGVALIVEKLRAGSLEIKVGTGGGSLHIIEEEWVVPPGWFNVVLDSSSGGVVELEGRGWQVVGDLKGEEVRCRVLTEIGGVDSWFFEVWVPKVRD